nr:DUF397 domain-containing protein [Streptomyces sp. SID3343]
MAWRTSSHSGTGGGDCVEVAIDDQTLCVRDSKVQTAAALRLQPHIWEGFLSRL